MKKIFVLSFALLAALVACNKDQIVPENNDAPAASFTATIADTKVTFTPDGQANEGLTSAFDGAERVFLWTVNTDSSNPKDKYTLFEAGTHTDKTSKFNISTNATYVYDVDPGKLPVNFGAYLVNYNCMGYDTTIPCYRFGYNSESFIKRLYFLAGNGSLGQATKVQALFASGTYDGTYPDLTFSYLTSILKVDVNLPDGSGATTANTKIYVKGSGMITQAQLSSTTAAITKNESPATPTFTITPAAGVIDGDHLVFYVPLWTGKTGLTITDATIDFVVGVNTYSISLGTKSVAPGKVYTFKPVAKPALKSIDKWVDDAAGSVTIATGLSETASEGLTYNSGTGEVSWAANTTGKPAKKTITFDSGESVAITQISVDDFKGDWTFNAKTFAGVNKIGLTASDTKVVSVNFGAPVGGGESLYDEDTKLTLTNNIGIRGLFGSKDAVDAAVMDAALRLDREKKIVEFYLFFDARKAQATTTGDATYPYIMFLPEFGGGFMSAPWDFCPFPLGSTQNYGYTKMTVNETASNLYYGNNNRWTWGNAG
ncbi:MAG: hypothetical protein IKZ60_01430, partial [Bacteroidales bacterium]|nr:hypothetical protein [Bacteroidales bacterium]